MDFPDHLPFPNSDVHRRPHGSEYKKKTIPTTPIWMAGCITIWQTRRLCFSHWHTQPKPSATKKASMIKWNSSTIECSHTMTIAPNRFKHIAMILIKHNIKTVGFSRRLSTFLWSVKDDLVTDTGNVQQAWDGLQWTDRTLHWGQDQRVHPSWSYIFT
jgi:hypothetical protein